MTDQCFDDEPDRGREPEPIKFTTNATGSWIDQYGNPQTSPLSVLYPPPKEVWMTEEQSRVLRNTAAKLELTKKALEEYMSELHGCANRQLSTTSVYFRIKNILKQLED